MSFKIYFNHRWLISQIDFYIYVYFYLFSQLVRNRAKFARCDSQKLQLKFLLVLLNLVKIVRIIFKKDSTRKKKNKITQKKILILFL